MKLFDGSVCCSIALSGAAAPHYTTLHRDYCSCSRRQSALEAQGLINLFGGIAAHKNVNLFNLVSNLLVTQPWLPFIKAPKVYSSCNVKMYQL